MGGWKNQATSGRLRLFVSEWTGVELQPHTLLRTELLLLALARFLDLMTSVFRLMGRGLPCSLRKRPQALQRTKPFSSRRQSGVVLVEQFWQTG
jgi:hypothetical protein